MQTATQLDVCESGEMQAPSGCARVPGSSAVLGGMSAPVADPGSKILRFAKSERMLHWAIAGPFLVSFASGAALVLLYNPDPTRPWRSLVAALHRVSGIALAILPMVALLSERRDVRIHLYNIKQAWTWVYDDFKWLALMGLAFISSRFVLPEQGKFNAAEKLNFMVLMSTYPLYVVTGFLMWVIPMAVLSWIAHCLMAMMATPLVVGHLYMALVNADTRPGLEGMISGHVDRQWAKHHYRRWYRKHHEADEHPAAGAISSTADVKDPVLSAIRQPVIAHPNINGEGILGHNSRLLAQMTNVDRESSDLLTIGYVARKIPGITAIGHQTHPNLIGGHDQYELAPGQFIRLCDKFRKADDVCAFFCGRHCADLSSKSDKQGSFRNFPDPDIYVPGPRVVLMARFQYQVMMVRAKESILSLPERGKNQVHPSRSHIFLKPGSVTELELSTRNWQTRGTFAISDGGNRPQILFGLRDQGLPFPGELNFNIPQ